MDHGGGADQITDFAMHLDQGHTDDQLDTSDLRNPDGSPVKAFDISVTSDGHGNAVLHFPGGETVVLMGVSPAEVSSPGMLHAMGVACFASGSLIATPQGGRAVETLRAGDLVLTEVGPERVIWHGHQVLTAKGLEARPELRPIRLSAGHFGLIRDLILSPQHAVKVGDALIRARHLAERAFGAHVARGLKAVRYHHILLARHALVQAEGAWVESFYPGREAIRALARCDQIGVARAILAQNGGIGGLQRLEQAYGPRCLPLLTGHAARQALTGLDPAQPRQIRKVRPPNPAPQSFNLPLF